MLDYNFVEELAKKFFGYRKRNRTVDGAFDDALGVEKFESLSFSFTTGKERGPCSRRERKSGYTLEFHPSSQGSNADLVLTRKELGLANSGSGWQ